MKHPKRRTLLGASQCTTTLHQALQTSLSADTVDKNTVIHCAASLDSLFHLEDEFYRGLAVFATAPSSFPSPHNCLALPRQRHAKSPALAFFSIPTTLTTSTPRAHPSLLCTTRPHNLRVTGSSVSTREPYPDCPPASSCRHSRPHSAFPSIGSTSQHQGVSSLHHICHSLVAGQRDKASN